MNRLTLPVAVVLGIVVVATAAGFTTRHSTTAPASSAVALQNTFVGVYRDVSPSVVQIRTPQGLGSGVVFDKAGNIVTNDHVVSGATSLTVTTASGQQLSAKLVGEFPADDLAVIR